jgi:aryl-alcohol dehydrogenase-like predicted oxidoreductase
MVLGTAQLGMPYGINNLSGQPDEAEACAVVKTAWDNGVSTFDTAQAYGASEAVLGGCFGNLGITGQVRVISKIDPALDCRDAIALDRALECSLKRLGQDRLSGFMLHHEKQLDDWDRGLRDWLVGQRRAGRINVIGVSVYSPVKAREAVRRAEVDFVQVTANVFDRRCDDAGIFLEADRLGKKVYVRSVFLQGLLLMEPGQLPARMSFAGPALKQWRSIVDGSGLSARALALGYALARWPSAILVLGAERAQQVKENVQTVALDPSSEIFRRVDEGLRQVDERLLEPWRWPKAE